MLWGQTVMDAVSSLTTSQVSRPWASYLTSQGLSFLFCKMGKIKLLPDTVIMFK